MIKSNKRGDNMDEPTVDQEKEREKMESLVSDLIQGVAPANKPIPIFKGRKKIYTNYINKEQVGDDGSKGATFAKDILGWILSASGETR